MLSRFTLCSRFLGLRLLVALSVLAIAIAACGPASTIGGNASPTATPRPTPTPPPTASDFVAVNRTASWTVSGLALHLIGLDTSGSPPTPLAVLGATCGSLLVFKTSLPTSLSAGDAQQIRSYLTALTNGSGLPYPSPIQQPPSTLAWIPNGDTCNVRLEISNVTSLGGGAGHDITINGLDLRLTSSPTAVPAAATYNLIDICSVVSGVFCEYPGFGPDNVYFAEVDLGNGGVGATYLGDIKTSDNADPSLYPAPPFDLPPGQTRDIDVTIKVPSGFTSASYQVVPELVVNNGGVQTLTYPELQTRLTFAQEAAGWRQWPCYGLVASPDHVVPDAQVHYDSGFHPSCY